MYHMTRYLENSFLAKTAKAKDFPAPSGARLSQVKDPCGTIVELASLGWVVREDGSVPTAVARRCLRIDFF